MKTSMLIIWVLLSQLLGGCYMMRTVQFEQLDQKALIRNTSYRITGVYLEDGRYVRFQPSDLVYVKWPKGYECALIVGDTLYGRMLSKSVAIPTVQIEHYHTRSHADGTDWVDGVTLKDGTSWQFEMNSPEHWERFDLPQDYKGPVMVRDTLYGAALSTERVSISVDKISGYQIHKLDSVSTGIAAVIVGGIFSGYLLWLDNCLLNPPCFR